MNRYHARFTAMLLAAPLAALSACSQYSDTGRTDRDEVQARTESDRRYRESYDRQGHREVYDRNGNRITEDYSRHSEVYDRNGNRIVDHSTQHREYYDRDGNRISGDYTQHREVYDRDGNRITESSRTETYRDDPDFPKDSPGTIDRFRKVDPSLATFFDTAYGYVVLPKVSKGGLGIGAAAGEGDVYEQGRWIGRARLTQVTVGAQIGGQTYSQVVFFKDKSQFDVFRDNNLEFAANASAIIAESGKGASNDYREGVAVFILPRAGAMLEAAIGGQKLSYIRENR